MSDTAIRQSEDATPSAHPVTDTEATIRAKSLPLPESARKPFLWHLQEMRRRASWVFVSILAGTALAYYYHHQIVSLVTEPLQQTLFYSSPGGGFDFLIKLSLLGGIFFAIPVFVYHLLRFFEPLLSWKSRFYLIFSLLVSSLLLALGVLFAYFIALPMAITFLNDFSSEQVQSLILTNDYLSFVMAYFLGFGIAFQLPLLLLIANAIRPFRPGELIKSQKWVIVACFTLAAIITPTPDIFNLLIMALPIILLYEISVALVWGKNQKILSRRTI